MKNFAKTMRQKDGVPCVYLAILKREGEGGGGATLATGWGRAVGGGRVEDEFMKGEAGRRGRR